MTEPDKTPFSVGDVELLRRIADGPMPDVNDRHFRNWASDLADRIEKVGKFILPPRKMVSMSGPVRWIPDTEQP